MMKTGSDNMDQLFKDKLGDFEADVNPAVWKNIEQGLKTPSHGVFNKVRVKKVISYLVISGAAILAVLYFTSKKTDQPVVSPTTIQEKTSLVNPVTNQKIVAPVVQAEDKKPSNVSTEVKRRNVVDRKSEKTPMVISAPADSKEKESSSSQMTSNPGIKDSKDHMTHEQKSSSSENTTEANEKPAFSHANEGSHDSKDITSGDNSGILHTEDYPVAEPENGFRFYAPTGFTPNGDGINDTYITSVLNFKDFEITIYDRYGVEVFHSKDIANTWDGRSKNSNEIVYGLYQYIINVKDLDGNNHSYTGKITSSPKY